MDLGSRGGSPALKSWIPAKEKALWTRFPKHYSFCFCNTTHVKHMEQLHNTGLLLKVQKFSELFGSAVEKRTRNLIYYTSDSPWKIWLVESIQSIHNSLWTWHDKYNICCRYCIYHVIYHVMLRFCFWGWIMWKMYNKTIIEFGFRMISWIIKTSCLCYLPQPSASADNTDLGFDNSWYHAQPHPIIV